MIKSFKDKETKALYINGGHKKFPQIIWKTSIRKLEMINAAIKKDDLKSPPGNRLEKLKGNLEDYFSIRINDQFRIVFQFKVPHAFNVYIDDYH
jgi:proteic killer suppression protein